MKRETLDLLVSETLDVQTVHPALELVALSDSVMLRGTIGFDMGSGSSRIKDAYQLRMQFPDDYPASPPVPYETGRAIPCGFEHVFADGSCCLGAPAEVRRRFLEHGSLLRFINERRKKYGRMPFGELYHGDAGLIQYYLEFFERRCLC